MENQINNSLKPRAGSVLTFGWNILWDKFITLFLILLVIWVSLIPLSVNDSADNNSFGAAILGAFTILYLIFIIAPLKVSAHFMYLKAVRGIRLDVKELFDVFNNYLNVVLATLLQFAIIGIGIAFLIVPGIIFGCRLAFVPYLVMDKKLDPVRAVEESWRLTRGYGWRIFWLGIVSFFLIIAGFIVFIFGAVISFMWINTAFAGFYQAVLLEKGEYTSNMEDAEKSAPNSEATENETTNKMETIEKIGEQ